MNNIYAYYNGILCGKLQTVFFNSTFAERFNLWMLRKRDSDHYTEEGFREIDMVQEEILVICKKELEAKRVSLERAILISLALEYRIDGTRLFTTTEISQLIN